LIYLLPITRSHRRSASPFRIAVCLLLTLGVLSEPAVAGAKAEPRKPRPAPEKLWKTYPLNPSPSRPERRLRQGTASVPQRSRPESLEQGDSWTLLAAIAATVAALGLAFALAPAAFVRARRSHRFGAAAARLRARLRRARQATLRLEPRLRRFRPALATANVVDDLLQAVAGGVPAAERMQDQVHALTAGGASASSAHERPRDRAEVELLRAKRTGADRNGVDISKAKLKSEATTRETSGLKDELDRLVLLCQRLVEATASRQVEWRLDEEEDDLFAWAHEAGSVSITSRDGDADPPYELGVYNPDREKVEELSSDLVGDDEPAPWNEPLAQLYRAARRSALRADDIIDAMIDALLVSEAEAGNPGGGLTA
jgi:hypothetical protein